MINVDPTPTLDYHIEAAALLRRLVAAWDAGNQSIEFIDAARRARVLLGLTLPGPEDDEAERKLLRQNGYQVD